MNCKYSIVALTSFLLIPAVFAATEKVTKLAVTETIEIAAPSQKVWAIVKDWDGLHKWHPAFSADEIKKGKNNAPRAVRTVTLRDSGASFDEVLDEYDARHMYYNYRIIGDSPLPVVHYTSHIAVRAGEGKGTSVLTWQGSFRRKVVENPTPEENDDGVKKFISEAYRAGLENVKLMAEAK